MSTNELSIEITQEKDAAITQVLDNLEAELDFLVDLNVRGRQSLAIMGRKNLEVVDRSHQHAQVASHFLPSYMPLEEFTKDVLLADWMRKIKKKVDKISDKIDDTTLLAEAEAYQTARLYYNSVKAAAKAGDERAEQIARDLAIHYKKYGATKNNQPTEKKEPAPQSDPQPENSTVNSSEQPLQ